MAVTVLNKARTAANQVGFTDSEIDWVRIAAGGSLAAGAVLMLAGQKRIGLVVAASGTALAMLDHEEAIRDWWHQMPHYIETAQTMFRQVQEVVENLAEKGESLRRVMGR